HVMVEMLIRLGADVMRKDQNGKTAVQMVESAGKEGIVTLLNEHYKIPRTHRTSRTAFDIDGNPYNPPSFEDVPLYLRRRLVGQAHGNLEYVQKTVKADPRMAHCVATTSEICVEACAHIGNKKIVEFLIKNGAPYSLPTAVMLNDFTTVKKLLEEDAKRIEERGAHDFGLLWYPVIGRCDLDMMQLLLDKGAKIEQQHFLGTTALHWACMRDQIEMVELLVQNGADVNRVGRKFSATGETPLQSAKDEKIVNYLRTKGAK
ncbi:MAG: ankyrin repeat domain-containing protein, partial [Cyclobacteriaceae bacterium]